MAVPRVLAAAHSYSPASFLETLVIVSICRPSLQEMTFSALSGCRDLLSAGGSRGEGCYSVPPAPTHRGSAGSLPPFIQRILGVGLPAGRQQRVSASPSSSTWSFSLMWKTGGKSGKQRWGQAAAVMHTRHPIPGAAPTRLTGCMWPAGGGSLLPQQAGGDAGLRGHLLLLAPREPPALPAGPLLALTPTCGHPR